MCYPKPMIKKGLLIVFLPLVLLLAACWLAKFLNGEKEVDRKAFLFLRSTFYETLTVDDFVKSCISNNVKKVVFVETHSYGKCLCCDIGEKYYCVQQTGQVMRFGDAYSAMRSLMPTSEKTLFDKDQAAKQAPNGFLSWLEKSGD